MAQSFALPIRSKYSVLRSSAVDLSNDEDISETTYSVLETGDHGRRPKLPPEPQTGMTTNKIVMTTREFELPVQSLFATRMSRTASTQIGDQLSDCQIEALDICRVRLRRILRFNVYAARQSRFPSGQKPEQPATPTSSVRATTREYGLRCLSADVSLFSDTQ